MTETGVTYTKAERERIAYQQWLAKQEAAEK